MEIIIYIIIEMNNMANIIMNNEDEIEFKTSGRNIIY
jgi:hypothetical protein